MNLTCVSETKVNSIKFTFLLVQTLSFCGMPFLVRAIGMKFSWTLGVLLQLGAFLAFYFIESINLAILVAIVYGLAGSQSAFSYTYIAQLVPESHLSFVSMLYCGLNFSNLGFQGIYFWKISAYYEHYMLFLIVASGLVFALGAFFLIEPPIALSLNGELGKAHNNIRYIQTFNRVGYK